jgi:hypothetical protein
VFWAGCGEPGGSTLLSTETAESALFFFEQGGAIEVLAIALDDEAVTTSGSFTEGTVITAIFYREPLGALGFGAGPLELVPPPGGRPPPRPTAGAWAGTIRDGGIAWSALAEIPPRIADLRLPGLDPIGCLRQGGCIAKSAPDLCNLPCTSSVAIAAPAPPRIAAPPEMSTCRYGWSLVDEDPPYCRPAALGQALECELGEAPFGEGCRPLGTCGPLWPADLPVGAIYVSANARVGGDGSEELPFLTLAEAIARRGAASVIAVAQGEYPESIELPNGVTIIGACAEGTRISAGDAPEAVVVRGSGAIRDLAISGGRIALLVTGSAELDRVIISGPGREGIEVRSGGVVHGREILISGRSYAALFADEASASLRRAAIVRDRAFGVLAARDARVELEDLAFRTVSATDTSTAVVVLERAAVTGEGVIASRGGVGIWLAHSSSCSMSDLAIGGTSYLGLSVHPENRATLSRLLIDHATKGAIRVEQDGELIVSDAILRGTQDGPGMLLDGGRGRFARVLSEENEGDAIALLGSASQPAVRLEDVWIRRNPSISSPFTGLLITRSASVTADRVRLEDVGPRDAVRIEDSKATIRDISITNVIDGSGIHVQGPAELGLFRAGISGASRFVIRAGGNSGPVTVTVEDLTATDAPDGLAFNVTASMHPISAIVRRAKIDHIRDASLWAGSQSEAHLFDVSVDDAPVGIRSSPGASATMTRFSISHVTTGAVVAGELDLSLGVLDAEETAFECEVPYDLLRLIDRVEVKLEPAELGDCRR